MSKIRKLDFVISEEDDERLIFRFYPRQSSCHSFNNEQAKSWDEVYKVYYSYSVLSQHKWNSDDVWETEKVFESKCDECSIIDSVGIACIELADGETQKIIEHEGTRHIWHYLDEKMQPLGDGVDWTIRKFDNQWVYDNLPGTKYQEYYEFILWRYDNVGYKFTLNASRMNAFGKYLDKCCEYMLAHGEPI